MVLQKTVSERIFLQSKINIDVIRHRVARVVHLHQPPVPAFAGYFERKFPIAFARLSAVDVADLQDDLPFKHKFLSVDPCYQTVDRYKISIAAAFLLAFDRINTTCVLNGCDPEIIPAYPLERQLVAAGEHLCGVSVVDFCFLLSSDIGDAQPGYGRKQCRLTEDFPFHNQSLR